MDANQGILQIADAVRSGRASAVESVEDCLRAIERSNARLNAFRETYPESALAAAKAIDRLIAAGQDPGLLAGAPIAIKDNIVTDFGGTSCGSRMMSRQSR